MSGGCARRRRYHRRLAIAALIALGAPGCSIPADDQVTPIQADDLGIELTATTTTTTTTTAPPTTEPPTVPGESTTTSSSTTLPTPTVDVLVYYSVATTDLMQQVIQPIASSGPVGVASIIELLVNPVTPLQASNLRTSLRQGLVVIETLDFVADRAELTVDLAGVVFNEMTEEQRQRAIAQLVLTLTSNTTPQGNVGLVRFTVDGQPIAINNPSTNTFTAVGEAVNYTDFQPLLSSTAPPAPTTTSTTLPAPPPSDPTGSAAPPTSV